MAFRKTKAQINERANELAEKLNQCGLAFQGAESDVVVDCLGRMAYGVYQALIAPYTLNGEGSSGQVCYQLIKLLDENDLEGAV